MNKHMNTSDFHTPYNASENERQKRREAMIDELNRTGSIPGFRTPVKRAVMNALDGGEMESVNRPYHYRSL